MVRTVVGTAVTVAVATAAVLLLFVVLDRVAESLPGRWERLVKPYLFVLPALTFVGIFLVYPTVQTVFDSFANSDTTKLVGLANYKALLVDDADGFHRTLLNSLIWIAVAPLATVLLGLVFAGLFDRLRHNDEKVAKTALFLPMAIGGVGTATIWRLVDDPDPRIGLQNAVWHGLLGRGAIAWLEDDAFHLNTFVLIAMLLWGQVGFAVVLLSAAIKSVPVDTVEAARIDGASELQTFRHVVAPQIRTTIVTVLVAVVIITMKIFDLLYVTTNGNFDTNVVGLEFFNQQNVYQNNGYAAAIVVILLLAVAPIMAVQVRHFRAQPGLR
jgi:alpha-glucoside transport system permease protein